MPTNTIPDGAVVPGGAFLPAVQGAGGSGDARNHGLWLISSAELDRWLSAQGRILTEMLDGLHSQDGTASQVNAVIDYAVAVATFIKKVRDGVAAVDLIEQHIISAIPDGDPNKINGTPYYTLAVQQS